MGTVRLGISGGGLMGRELASAAARWRHLAKTEVRPEIIAVRNRSEPPRRGFTERLAQVKIER